MASGIRSQELILPSALLFGVLVLVFPLPAPMIDGLLALNLSAAIVILVTAVMIRSPLEFSVFPTLLLTTTMSRLVLNVATTRLILADADVSGLSSAGGVIRGFAEFVARDDIVVGGIIFAILVLIQFLVITKGATRISEVAARFSLDGLPGRQMAIDADVSAGTIDSAEACRRREQLQQEAEFHGAMDGASKFLRGDALAGMAIIAINLVGGLTLGISKAGMTLGEAAEVYSKLTIGDGLVSQLPALLISVAAGIVITRNSSRAELGSDMFRQLLSRPQPLLLAVAFLLVLTLARFPALPLLAVGGTLMALAFSPMRVEAPSENVAQSAPPSAKPKKPEPDPSQSLAVDPLGIEVGLSLVRLADPSRAGTILQAIAELRHRVAREMGILLPKVRIRDNLALDEATYRLMFYDAEVACGTCPRRHVFAMFRTPGNRPERDATVPPGEWILPDRQPQARSQGHVILSPSEYIVEHMRRVVMTRAADLLTRDAVHRLIEQARPNCGVAVDELIPDRLSLGELQKVLQLVVADGHSIRNLPLIIETLCDESQSDRDVTRLAKCIRTRLAQLSCSPELSHA